MAEIAVLGENPWGGSLIKGSWAVYVYPELEKH